MKYKGKALENLWNLLKEIEDAKQFKNNEGKIRLPRYPSNSSMDANETRKNMLDHLSSLKAIKDLHPVKTRRGNEDYLLWAFFEDDNYQKISEQIKYESKFHGKVTKTNLIKEMNKIINSEKFSRSKQSKKLLTLLSNFDFHSIEELVGKGVSKSPNALSHLKDEVNTKLSDTNFFIDSVPGKFSDPGGLYKLNLKNSSN